MAPSKARILFAALLAQSALGATCVDGATPDCSDPAANCAPSLDGSADRVDALVLPETSGSDASSDVDAAEADVLELDAGDAG